MTLTLTSAARGIVIFAVLCVSACCSDRTETIDVEYEGGFEAAQRAIVARYQADGWDCANVTAIRNAAGRTIGQHYVCTKCER